MVRKILRKITGINLEFVGHVEGTFAPRVDRPEYRRAFEALEEDIDPPEEDPSLPTLRKTRKQRKLEKALEKADKQQLALSRHVFVEGGRLEKKLSYVQGDKDTCKNRIRNYVQQREVLAGLGKIIN